MIAHPSTINRDRLSGEADALVVIGGSGSARRAPWKWSAGRCVGDAPGCVRRDRIRIWPLAIAFRRGLRRPDLPGAGVCTRGGGSGARRAKAFALCHARPTHTRRRAPAALRHPDGPDRRGVGRMTVTEMRSAGVYDGRMRGTDVAAGGLRPGALCGDTASLRRRGSRPVPCVQRVRAAEARPMTVRSCLLSLRAA